MCLKSDEKKGELSYRLRFLTIHFLLKSASKVKREINSNDT